MSNDKLDMKHIEDIMYFYSFPTIFITFNNLS